MHKITLILKREYLTRVKKRSFVIMTLIGPLLMAAIFIVPVYISTRDGQEKTIGIVDETNIFDLHIAPAKSIRIEFLDDDIDSLKNNFSNLDYYAILYIPRTEVVIPGSAILYSTRQPGLDVISHLKTEMKREIEKLKLAAAGIDTSVLESVKTAVHIDTFKIDEQGNEEKSYTELSMILGWVGGFLIYMFIFMYGAQVMRGVIEEKSSRIVEILVSSVKPFQLMMGKIVGIALVGLTQFVLWVLITLAIVTAFTTIYSSDYLNSDTVTMISADPSGLIPAEELPGKETPDYPQLEMIYEAINAINYDVVIGFFIFFFLGGYLLYAALFAAIGAAVDSEADTQQFMLPITIPLIIAIVLIPYVINNPDAPLIFWMSIIPLTSPVLMMARIPFGVPYLDIILSVLLLILGFLGTTWMAAKIYRTGILMYGKKVNYRELWKWLTFKS